MFFFLYQLHLEYVHWVSFVRSLVRSPHSDMCLEQFSLFFAIELNLLTKKQFKFKIVFWDWIRLFENISKHKNAPSERLSCLSRHTVCVWCSLIEKVRFTNSEYLNDFLLILVVFQCVLTSYWQLLLFLFCSFVVQLLISV